MRKKILFCVLLVVISKCDSHEHRPTVLGGLLTGAHELGTKVQNVLGGLAQGALNFGGHIEANRVQSGYQNQRPPAPPQHNGDYRPGNPPKTIIVVVETDGHSQHQHNHNHHGHSGHRPPHHGGGPPNNYDQPNYPNRPGYGSNPQNSGPWNNNGNNYNKPQNPRPGYGYNPQGQPNYNGNPYNNNNGNYNQNNYGRPNDGNFNQNYGTKPPTLNNGNSNQNNYGSPPPNNGNYNQNNYNTKPNNENFGQNGGAQTPTFNSGTSNQNPFGNIPNSPPPFEKPTGGYQDQNKPSPDLTTNPENRPQYGSVYDVNKETTNNIPTRKPDTNVNSNDHTTKKPDDDDTPLFVPLNPNQYQYGGDKIEVNAPKRETNLKPAEDDDESYPIDVRFGD